MGSFIRTIVCSFATASISGPLMPIFLTGCAAEHMIFGGIGEQINDATDWERDGTTYGKVGYRGVLEVHQRDKVDFYWELNHKSHPGRRDRGEENAEAGFQKRF